MRWHPVREGNRTAPCRQRKLTFLLRFVQDKNPTAQAEANERFRLLSEAYETLSDPDLRAAYDYDLAQGGTGGMPHRGVDEAQYRHARSAAGHSAHFHDPFDVFRAFFGGRDPFASALFDDHPVFAAGRRAHADPWAAHHAMLANAMMMTSASSHGMSMFDQLAAAAQGGSHAQLPPGATSVSTQTQTSIVNGVRVTRTTRTVRHADGRLESETTESTDRVGGFGGTQQQPQQTRRLPGATQPRGSSGGGVTDVVPSAASRPQAGQVERGFFGRSWF